MLSFFDAVVVFGGLMLTLFTRNHNRVVVVDTYLLPCAHSLTFLPPTSRTRASSHSSVLTMATKRRSFSSTSSQCFFHPVKRRQTPSILFLSSSVKDSIEMENNSTNNSTMIKDSYQRVAEQDPEWFQEYVLSILGEDSLDEDYLTTTTTTSTRFAPAASLESTETQQQQQQQQQEKSIAMPSSDENIVASVSLISSSSSVAPSLLSMKNSTSENDKDEQDVAEKQLQLQSSMSGQPVSEKGEKNQTFSLASSASMIKPSDKSQLLIPQKEEEAVVKRVRRIFDDVVEELHPTSSLDDDDNANDIAVTSLVQEEQVVVKPVKDEPKEQVLGVQVKTADGEKNEEETTASIDDFSINDNPDQKLFEPLSSQPPDATTSLVNTSAAVSLPTKKESEATESSETRTTSASQRPLSSKRIMQEDDIDAIKEDRVVLYKGTLARPWRRVPLANLTALGYNEREIVSLQPDALDLIVSEGITKPRSGIPSRWKTIKKTITADSMGTGRVASDSNSFVQIMSTSDADRFVMQQRAEKRLYQNEKYQQGAGDGEAAAAGPEGPGRDGESRRTRERSRAWNGVEEQNRDISQDSDRRRQQRRRERTQYTDDGRPKRVYSGRPDGPPPGTRSTARRDPPAPDSFLWPDVDTFRDLLRKEASFRLAILGDDWRGVVKDESDWRLNLYTDWLWTLHNGWGSPIVESRSDRMRKSLNRSRPPREPPPPPPPQQQQQQQQRQQRPSPYDDNDTDIDDKRRPLPRAKRSRQKQKEEE